MAITIFDKLGKKYVLSIPIVAIIVFLGKLVRVDYGWYGVLSVFVLYVFREQKWGRVLGFMLLNVIYYDNRLFVDYSTANLISYVFSSVPVFLLLFYQGKLGRKTKYLYYIFYPVHMGILYAISFL